MSGEILFETLITIGMVMNWRQRGPWMLFLAGMTAGHALTSLFALVSPMAVFGAMQAVFNGFNLGAFVLIFGTLAVVMWWVFDRW